MTKEPTKTTTKKQGKTPKKHTKYLVTAALPYVNNVPHLGNIIGCVLSADVFARFLRSQKKDIIYICATDEYGTTTETKAQEEGLTPKQICDKYHKIHKDVYDWFGIGFNYFGRTSDITQTKITQNIFLSLHKNGFILEKELEQSYCKKCDKFLADRFIEGTCPHCGYAHARGDQCESCGKLLNPVDLLESQCKICRMTPEVKKTKHLFLDLPKLEPQLKSWVEKTSKEGFWPPNAEQFTNAWFKEGLKERCITRDLKWGIPVPLKGYEKKVFYVWFDAPIGYISATKQFTDQDNSYGTWEDWWLNPDVDIKLVQFMAKDNIPFHTIVFPCSLIGTKESWTLLHHISSIEYLNYEDGKFSKSKGTGVFGDGAIASGIPPDVWRYYLLINRPENSDTLFHWRDFQEKTNSELIGNLGNFVNRALMFCKKQENGKVSGVKPNAVDKDFLENVRKHIGEVTDLLTKVKLKDGLKTIMEISRLGNQYFQKQEPWRLAKSDNTLDQARAQVVISLCVNIVRTLAVLIEPYLPFTTKEIFRQLNLEYETLSKEQRKELFAWDKAGEVLIPDGHVIAEPSPLFHKLEDETIQKLREKFKGKIEKKTFSADPKIEKENVGVILEVSDLKVQGRNMELERIKKDVITQIDIPKMKNSKEMKAYFALLEKRDKQDAPPAPINLYEQIEENGKLPTLNTVADAYNVMSAKTGIVMGAYDADKIHGNVKLKIADGTEHFVTIGSTSKEKIIPGEYVYIDEANKVITRLMTKQAEYVKVSGSTKRVIMCIQGNKEIPRKKLLKIAKETAEFVIKINGGKYKVLYE